MSRREFLSATGGLTAGVVVFGGVDEVISRGSSSTSSTGNALPFFGEHQGGIITTRQAQTQFATFDVLGADRVRLAGLLRTWTDVSADLAAGQPAGPVFADEGGAPADSGEQVGLGPSRLTINVGFGPSLFGIGGPDRFGLGRLSPVPLVDLPPFPGDRLTPATSGGDLAVHICADDAQVAFHALRQLTRAAEGVAAVRWCQAGFNAAPADGTTSRNLLGFKDGTSNPTSEDDLATFVWVGEEGPDWMTGGTYAVVRRIRVALADWDHTSLRQQQQVIGRYKDSGAPLGRSGEFDALDLSSRNLDGTPVIPADAHVRMASAEQNWGARMLRRSYEYDNGFVTGDNEPVADAGLLFCCYQRYPVVAFIPIYERLAVSDALTAFTTHTASAIFAMPGGVAHRGDWIGRQLLEA